MEFDADIDVSNIKNLEPLGDGAYSCVYKFNDLAVKLWRLPEENPAMVTEITTNMVKEQEGIIKASEKAAAAGIDLIPVLDVQTFQHKGVKRMCTFSPIISGKVLKYTTPEEMVAVKVEQLTKVFADISVFDDFGLSTCDGHRKNFIREEGTNRIVRLDYHPIDNMTADKDGACTFIHTALGLCYGSSMYNTIEQHANGYLNETETKAMKKVARNLETAVKSSKYRKDFFANYPRNFIGMLDNSKKI